jgi:hypothetical protein
MCRGRLILVAGRPWNREDGRGEGQRNERQRWAQAGFLQMVTKFSVAPILPLQRESV